MTRNNDIFSMNLQGAINRILSLMAENERMREEKNATCIWIQEDDEWGTWTTECGKSCVTEGTLEENGFKYCSYCGRLIFETVYYEEEEEEDE